MTIAEIAPGWQVHAAVNINNQNLGAPPVGAKALAIVHCSHYADRALAQPTYGGQLPANWVQAMVPTSAYHVASIALYDKAKLDSASDGIMLGEAPNGPLFTNALWGWCWLSADADTFTYSIDVTEEANMVDVAIAPLADLAAPGSVGYGIGAFSCQNNRVVTVLEDGWAKWHEAQSATNVHTFAFFNGAYPLLNQNAQLAVSIPNNGIHRVLAGMVLEETGGGPGGGNAYYYERRRRT